MHSAAFTFINEYCTRVPTAQSQWYYGIPKVVRMKKVERELDGEEEDDH